MWDPLGGGANFDHREEKCSAYWGGHAYCLFEARLIKQIFHAFLFNFRNYSPEVINIQRREKELNIILQRVNNFDIKQNKA